MARLLQNVETKLHAALSWRPSNLLLIHTALHLTMALCCAVLTHADAASRFQTTTIRIAARIDNPSDFLASPRKFLQHDEWSISRQIVAKQAYLALVARYLPLPIPWTMGLNSTMGTAYAAGFAFAACAVAHGFVQDPMHFPARDALKRAVGAVAFAFANYLPWEAMFDLQMFLLCLPWGYFVTLLTQVVGGVVEERVKVGEEVRGGGVERSVAYKPERRDGARDVEAGLKMG